MGTPQLLLQNYSNFKSSGEPDRLMFYGGSGSWEIVDLVKSSFAESRQVAEEYRQTHPEVTVLDPPDAIQHVYNRRFMLQDVDDLNLSDAYGKVGVPRQLVIKKDPASIPMLLTKLD